MGSRVGSRFGPYQLTRLLGAGGFGEVYAAHDTDKDRMVALKLMTAAYSADPTFRQRLFREASTAGRLNEPHVIPIHSYGEIDGQIYIDMRLVEGTDLQKLLTSTGPLHPDRAVAIIRQIAAALDAAHAATLVHRDIKPANILITDDDFAYLADFGLANAATDTKLTNTGTTIGTMAYLAPERFTHLSNPDHRADIYALACVLYECLTGTPPYQATDLPALMGAHLAAPIPQPSHHPGVPTAFDHVIAVGMAKDPTNRYPTAGALATAAHYALTTPNLNPHQGATQHAGIQTHWPTPTPTPTSPARRRPSRRAVLTTTLALIGIVIVALGIKALPHPTTHPTHTQTQAEAQPQTQQQKPASRQTQLPLQLWTIEDIAIGADGTLYAVGRSDNHPKVLKLAAGSNTPTEVAFPGLQSPSYIAVDTTGAIYVTDYRDAADPMYSIVRKLSAGSSSPTELALPGIDKPRDVVVDAAGDLYINDFAAKSRRIWKVPAGSGTPILLPFPTDFFSPRGIAVDGSGNVYVTTLASILKLAPGSAEAIELPRDDFNGLIGGIAVDSRGDIYTTVYSENLVIKLAAGNSEPVTLPFTGLSNLDRVAVDADRNVYVINDFKKQVLKLAAQ